MSPNSTTTPNHRSPAMRILRTTLQILLPLVVLAGTYQVASQLVANMKQPATTTPAAVVPIVRTIKVAPTSLRMDVSSQGTVQPAQQVELAPQVGGRVETVSAKLRPGGFFAAGEVLLTIDPRDYQLALVQRRAEVARARLRLAQEKAEAEVAQKAWQQLEGERTADELATRELHVATAEAELAAAEAAVERAQLDLQRTRVAAPFDGRVRSADLEPGDLVQPGKVVASIYGTKSAEVRLPIPDNQVAFLDLPLDDNQDENHQLPTTRLVADFAGTRHEWQGVIARTEGEIDQRTRQLTLVARVDAPYAAVGDRRRPPLTPGMFVEADITGRVFDDVVALPRQALRPDGAVLLLDQENKLRSRNVSVIRVTRDDVFVRGGLTAQDRVCISVVEEFVEGMPVEPAPELVPAGSRDR